MRTTKTLRFIIAALLFAILVLLSFALLEPRMAFGQKMLVPISPLPLPSEIKVIAFEPRGSVFPQTTHLHYRTVCLAGIEYYASVSSYGQWVISSPVYVSTPGTPPQPKKC